MSAGYKPVLWNKYKKQYDLLLWATILLYLGIFISYNLWAFPTHNFTTILIRAFGTLAILLLHFILAIGPASRLWQGLLPVLYNRRHLGVSMFFIAALHGALSLMWFHSGGNVSVLESLFTSNTHYGSLIYFPFQPLGFIALLILAVMAFTSHDFWLHFLSPRIWKTLHMLVYLAYALIILHVALGIIQLEKSPVLVVLLFIGLIGISYLHIAAAIKEGRFDRKKNPEMEGDWIYACKLDEIPEDRARVAIIGKERVAIFKYDGKLSAVHNVCKHQMGPLGEGKVVDGCITCPWHGYQYRPEDGCAPPPFKEKVHTYKLKLVGDGIFIDPQALPEGSFVEPLVIPDYNTIPEKIFPFFIAWSSINIKSLLTIPKLAAFSSAGCFLILAFVFASQQQNISRFQINYDTVREMKGWLENKPLPTLTITDGKDIQGNPIFKTILLVDALKKGAAENIEKVLNGAAAKYVSLTGYLSNNYIHCGVGDTDCVSLCTQCITGTTEFPLMELENGVFSFKEAVPPVSLPVHNEIFRKDTLLTGEIIDPKCYYGAMNPGQGKPHLSCAIRCISGGIMPVLKYEKDHIEKYAILLGRQGEPINQDIRDLIGPTVTIQGTWARLNNWEILYTEPKQNIKRTNQ